MEKKLILPVVTLAAVGIVGSVYTLKHAGPSSVNAQTVSISPAPETNDKETADDAKTEQIPTHQDKNSDE